MRGGALAARAACDILGELKREEARRMGYWVYMLRCGDGSLYTGCTNDLSRRLRAHQSGRGAKYTRSRLPVELAYWEAAEDRSAALRREASIKAMTRAEKLALLPRESPGLPGDPPPSPGKMNRP